MIPEETILFLRLIFGLIIDLLIAKGYLLPSQREPWVNGAVSLVGASGAVSLLAIYQHHSHKKALAQNLAGYDSKILTTIGKVFSWIAMGIFTKKVTVTDPGITHPETPPQG